MSSQKPTHWCRICGSEYLACDNCAAVGDINPWRSICDTQQHYQVFMIVKMLSDGVMNKTEANDALKHIGVTEKQINTFIPAVKEKLKALIAPEVVIDKVEIKETIADEDVVEKPKSTKKSK